MLIPGTMQEIAEQIQNTSLQIAALQKSDGKGADISRKKIIHFTIAVTRFNRPSVHRLSS
jgi:hypothetical protein